MFVCERAGNTSTIIETRNKQKTVPEIFGRIWLEDSSLRGILHYVISDISENSELFTVYAMKVCRGLRYTFTFITSTLYGGGRSTLCSGRFNPPAHKNLGYPFWGS